MISSSKLREALRDKIEETRGYIGHLDYASEIEQNAAQTVLRVLEELDQVVEYEYTPGGGLLIVTGGSRAPTPEEAGRLIEHVARMRETSQAVVIANGDPITFSEELRGLTENVVSAGPLIERLKCEEAERFEENEQRYYSREGWTKIDKKHGKRKTNRAQALGGGKKAGRVGLKIPARPRGRLAR